MPPQQQKKPGKGKFKNMFRKKPSESSSLADNDPIEPDIVEEIFEDGSAMLSQRSVLKSLFFCFCFSIICSQMQLRRAVALMVRRMV